LIVAFMPLFLLLLCTLQLAFLAQASLVVRHAAVVAARKAAVVLDDDPVYYDGAPRAVLSGQQHGAGMAFGLAILELLANGGASGANSPAPSGGERQGGARVSAIRDAAYLPLAAVTPSIEHLRIALAGTLRSGRIDSVASSIGSTPWARVVSGYTLFAPAATALTFPAAPMSTRLRPPDAAFAAREPITTRISILWPCTVPIARVLICKSFLQQLALAPEESASIRSSAVRSPTGLSERIRRVHSGVQGDAAWLAEVLAEAEQAEYPWLWLAYLVATDEHFVLLRAEATLPSQGAPSQYASELERRRSERTP
jgi:Flp pilus assembly protein TadG